MSRILVFVLSVFLSGASLAQETVAPTTTPVVTPTVTPKPAVTTTAKPKPKKKKKTVGPSPLSTGGTIDQEFQYIYDTSGSWTTYKSIKKTIFLGLKKSVKDSIEAYRGTIAGKEVELENALNSVAVLNKEKEQLHLDLEQAKNSKDSRSVLGIEVSKDLFQTILIISYAVLLFAMGFFAFKYRSNAGSTKEAINELHELKEEFENHRKTSLKRFQEVNRKLQDELNRKWKTGEK